MYIWRHIFPFRREQLDLFCKNEIVILSPLCSLTFRLLSGTQNPQTPGRPDLSMTTLKLVEKSLRACLKQNILKIIKYIIQTLGKCLCGAYFLLNLIFKTKNARERLFLQVFNRNYPKNSSFESISLSCIENLQ